LLTKSLLQKMFIFSLPEHKVLMVSYCGQWLFILRQHLMFTLYRDHICDTIFIKLGLNVCVDNI